MLADGVLHLDPASAVFEAMLAGWATQQRARFLKVNTIEPRLELVRRFAAFTNQYPWQWEPAEAEAFITSSPVAVSTASNYQNTLRLFCAYASDVRYGWVARCLEQFGSVPRQILDEWNTVAHVTEYEGQPHRRPLTYDEVQALFDAADGRVGEIRSRGRKGALAAQRDAALLKTVYAFGLRRTETARLDVADFGRNPRAPQFGRYGTLNVRYGKAKRGQPPRRRNVLSVMGWAVEAVADYAENIRPKFGFADHPALWVTERGGRVKPAEINARFTAYRDALGLPRALTVHSERHAYVTHLTEDGTDRRFIQLLLSPRIGVHDVQDEPLTGADLRGGGGYLTPSITLIPRRFDACSAGSDARLVA